MAIFTKHVLSASTNGRPISVTATLASQGTTLHTAPTGTTGADEVWLWGVNTATFDIQTTVEFGGVSGADAIPYTIPNRNGLHLLCPGLTLNNALDVKVYTEHLTTGTTASTNNLVNIIGYVNRIAT